MKKLIILFVIMFAILFSYSSADEKISPPSRQQIIEKSIEASKEKGRICASELYILIDNGQCIDKMCVIDETIDHYGNITQYIDVSEDGKCDIVLVFQIYYYGEKDLFYYQLFDIQECPIEM